MLSFLHRTYHVTGTLTTPLTSKHMPTPLYIERISLSDSDPHITDVVKFSIPSHPTTLTLETPITNAPSDTLATQIKGRIDTESKAQATSKQLSTHGTGNPSYSTGTFIPFTVGNRTGMDITVENGDDNGWTVTLTPAQTEHFIDTLQSMSKDTHLSDLRTTETVHPDGEIDSFDSQTVDYTHD